MLPPFFAFTQMQIKGRVQDTKKQGIFAANVFLKSSPQTGVTTDFEGNFSLFARNSLDTLIVSFIGYKTKKISLANINVEKKLIVILKEKDEYLEAVLITAKDPISEQFSVTKMTMLKDVYLNPTSQGDPLKAIVSLPASTNTDETANPSLRGSSTDRTRVLLNGVPIYNPVKSSQLNNQGFFSLFNPELIEKQYVYASNPPLIYGNASAGLVEIQTIRNLKNNSLSVSNSLANLGIFLSQKIRKDTSFIQIYGNFQFSDAFVGIQKKKLPNVKTFYTKDIGINFHREIGKKWKFNSYNYYIDENFRGIFQSFAYSGNVSSLNKRVFTVNNLEYFHKKGVLSINFSTNIAKQNVVFGNINSKQSTKQIYTSINYKWFLTKQIKLQFGISYDYHFNRFKDSIPKFFYAISPDSPHFFSKKTIHNHILETYLYTHWDINDRFTIQSGIRSNLPMEKQKYYLSSQVGLKYNVSSEHSLLLSGGNYYSYSVPSYYSKVYNLLQSYQIALDYTYQAKNLMLKSAVYYKEEVGEQAINVFFKTEKTNTLGVEFFVEYDFFRYFKYSFSNAFIDQKIIIDQKEYRGSKDFNFLLKSTLQYNHPKLFSLAISYMGRPGMSYNKVERFFFDSSNGFYVPLFSDKLYASEYKNYHRFDLSLSKYIRLNKQSFVFFFSINNLFDYKNEKSDLYTKDYSRLYFDYYQFRTFYFGMVWQLRY